MKQSAFVSPYDSVDVCRPCLMSLVRQMAEGATEDPVLRQQAVEASEEVIDRMFGPGVVPARVATVFGRVIKEVTHCADPFAGRKEQEIFSARRAMAQIVVERDFDRLMELSVAGNSVDYFLDPKEVAQELVAPVEFVVDDRPAFREALEAVNRAGKEVFFLTDNASEAFFDWPLARFLAQTGAKVVYAVKGGPVQNDCTLADLAGAGLHPDGFEVLDNGTDAVGTDREQCALEFWNRLMEAGLILSKGMANYETLRDTETPDILFLLKAKCQVNADLIGVPRGSYVALLRRATDGAASR
ncbi:MAG: DUF89 family protein [Deltaproteobacteria bacterium]|nr:DUF89 family protein [Deltaproteobacteria bacterium]